MTRLAVLSDVHANTPALRVVIDDLRSRDVDGVVYLGDIVFRGPDPGGAIDLMASLEPVAWIRGNTDEWYLEGAEGAGAAQPYVDFALPRLTRPQRAFLADLPRTATVNLDGTTMLCVHGSPRDQAENIFPDTPLEPLLEGVDEDVVVCGHTHLPFLRRSGATVVFNVGSVGMPFDGDNKASYGLVTATSDSLELNVVHVRYSMDAVVEMAREAGLPNVDKYETTIRTGISSF
jgi:putative phosphoesterase